MRTRSLPLSALCGLLSLDTCLIKEIERSNRLNVVSCRPMMAPRLAPRPGRLCQGPSPWWAVRQVCTMSSGTGINGSDTSPSACWRTRVRAKRFAVLVRPKDVRLISLMRRRWQTGGPAAAGMLPWPCPGGHRCRVRGSRLPGDGARRSAASVRCCPAGTTVPGTRVRWSCHTVLLPLVTARVPHRRLR